MREDILRAPPSEFIDYALVDQQRKIIGRRETNHMELAGKEIVERSIEYWDGNFHQRYETGLTGYNVDFEYAPIERDPEYKCPFVFFRQNREETSIQMTLRSAEDVIRNVWAGNQYVLLPRVILDIRHKPLRFSFHYPSSQYENIVEGIFVQEKTSRMILNRPFVPDSLPDYSFDIVRFADKMSFRRTRVSNNSQWELTFRQNPPIQDLDTLVKGTQREWVRIGKVFPVTLNMYDPGLEEIQKLL